MEVTMKPILTHEEANRRLETLFQQAQIRDEELQQYIKQVITENDALKLSLHKLRTAQASKANTTSSMHSKLTDALRE